MKKMILFLASITHSALCMQEEHPYEIAHSQERPYKVHCQNEIVNLSEYEWTLLRQSSKVIQDASDFYNNDDEEEENNRIIIELTCIKRSTLENLLHLLETRASRSSYTLNRIHKLLLGASYLNIDPQIITVVIPHLKELLDSPDITTPIVKEILFSDYAQANRTMLNQPIPITPCIKTLKGHSKAIRALTVWGQYLVSGSADNTIKIWDYASTECIKTLKGHTNDVNAFVVWNNMLVSGSNDYTIKLWNFSSDECIETLHNYTGEVNALAIWGNILASGDNKTIKLWNLSSRQCIQRLEGHRDAISTLAIWGNILISGSDDHDISLWDLSTNQYIDSIIGTHQGAIKSLAVWDNILVSGSYDTKISLWDLSADDYITTFGGHSEAVRALAIVGNTLVSGSHDTNIRLWERSARYSATLRDHDDWVTALTTWNNILASGSFDTTIKLWDISAFDPKQYTPAQNALMRTLLKNKENGEMLTSILQDSDWKNVYSSLLETTRHELEESIPLIQSMNLLDNT